MLTMGFDIGGTRIKGGLVEKAGEREGISVLAEDGRDFPREGHWTETVKLLKELSEALLGQSGLPGEEAVSIGVAVPGSLDPGQTMVIDAHNLNFHNVPLKEAVETAFPGKTVRIANDADAATLAEWKMGALQGCKTAVLLTLGTGVGGGLILNGELFRGGMGHGIEPGHMRLLGEGPLCTCGNRGCLETVCSAQFFERQGLSAEAVFEKARAGDPDARRQIDRYTDFLADGLVSIAMLLDPEIIALGGGISQAGRLLFDPLRAKVEARSFFRFPHKILPARLGNRAGFLGAALL